MTFILPSLPLTSLDEQRRYLRRQGFPPPMTERLDRELRHYGVRTLLLYVDNLSEGARLSEKATLDHVESHIFFQIRLSDVVFDACRSVELYMRSVVGGESGPYRRRQGLSFGDLCEAYALLPDRDKEDAALSLGLHRDHGPSWIKFLMKQSVEIRNSVAHHAPLARGDWKSLRNDLFGSSALSLGHPDFLKLYDDTLIVTRIDGTSHRVDSRIGARLILLFEFLVCISKATALMWLDYLSEVIDDLLDPGGLRRVQFFLGLSADWYESWKAYAMRETLPS